MNHSHCSLAGRALLLGGALLLASLSPLAAQGVAPARPWFQTLVAHWIHYDGPDYLDFLADARPEVAQVGFYGVTFYSLAHTPAYKGYPAHLPVQGTRECSEWFARLNREAHARGVKVVGHFNMTFIFGDPAKKAGFFEWYDRGWDEAEFGPKPCVDPTEMLQRDKTGKLISTPSYSVGGWPEFHGCLNNPKWRACLKPMVKSAITRGVDGLIANYFYRRDCFCEHCVGGFRQFLTTNYTAVELRERLGIADVKTHQFEEIPFWHDPKTTTPFRMAALRWSQLGLKAAFDDVLLDYGRKLKPDLLVAQWNHLGAFSQINGDERSALPGAVWGRGEDYLWYSTGNAASQTDLANGDLGDGTLQLRYIRGAFGPKPFLLGKYEQTRTRASIAEGIANGGAGMGFYAPHRSPEGRAAFVSYFGFARTNRALYTGAQPAAELLLLYPRSAVHAGNVEPVARFKALGKRLAHDGFAFDIVPDDLLAPEHLAGRRAVTWCDASAWSTNALRALAGFHGTRLPVTGTNLPPTADTWAQNELATVSRREGSPTVVLSVLAQPESKRLLAHLVNYNRQEPTGKVPRAGRGPQDELPIAVENVTVRLQLPPGKKVKRIRLLSPDAETPARTLAVKQSGGVATFTVPKLLVYAVAVADWE